MTLQQHPLSAAFPAMSADDFQALKDSIEGIGVQNPVAIFEGMVIDGWHRYQAAEALGMDCPMAELHDVDPRDFVLAQNKARRHITQAQLALAATDVFRWAAPGKPKSAGTAELRQEDIAKKAGVSVRTLRQAAKVKDAAPEVQQAVRSGEVGMDKAMAVAKLPQAEQAAAIAKPLPKAAPAAAPEQGREELNEAAHAINELEAEIQQLRDQIAVGFLDGTPEQKAEAAAVIAELRAEIATLNAELDAMRISRDAFQAENSELMKQVQRQQRELKKPTKGA